jgi:ribosome-binding factor A
MAGTKRQQKFGNLIKEELSSIFSLLFSSAFAGKLVTITDVVMSPDLGLARVYVSVFPLKHSDELLEVINDHKSKVRGNLGKSIGNQVRVIPELAFFLDATAENADRMDKLIDSLNIPPTTDEGE